MNPPRPDPSEVIAAVLSHAADLIESRSDDGPFYAGLTVWATVYQVVGQFVTEPAFQALRKHLRVRQVQHWDATKATVVATLRQFAVSTGSYEELQASAAIWQVEHAQSRLCRTLGVDSTDCPTLSQVTTQVTRDIHRLEGEAERQEQEIAGLRAQLAALETPPDAGQTPDTAELRQRHARQQRTIATLHARNNHLISQVIQLRYAFDASAAAKRVTQALHHAWPEMLAGDRRGTAEDITADELRAYLRDAYAAANRRKHSLPGDDLPG